MEHADSRGPSADGCTVRTPHANGRDPVKLCPKVIQEANVQAMPLLEFVLGALVGVERATRRLTSVRCSTTRWRAPPRFAAGTRDDALEQLVVRLSLDAGKLGG